MKSINRSMCVFKDYCDGYNDAVKDFNEKYGWISVKDRLPEKDDLYLAYDGYDHEILLFDFYGTKLFMTFDDNEYPCYRKNITHWMPLPEAPKEEEK